MPVSTLGLFPAWAGKPRRLGHPGRQINEVYPRVGGETDGRYAIGTIASKIRSIPAWAGKPTGGLRRLHARGLAGLSPRGRGNLPLMVSRQIPARTGSIPAWAGKPAAPPCRGSSAGHGSIPAWAGKPPPLTGYADAMLSGSIPAWAGKPHGSAQTPTQPVILGLSPRGRGNRR